jgi:hypothetical protein
VLAEGEVYDQARLTLPMGSYFAAKKNKEEGGKEGEEKEKQQQPSFEHTLIEALNDHTLRRALAEKAQRDNGGAERMILFLKSFTFNYFYVF